MDPADLCVSSLRLVQALAGRRFRGRSGTHDVRAMSGLSASRVRSRTGPGGEPNPGLRIARLRWDRLRSLSLLACGPRNQAENLGAAPPGPVRSPSRARQGLSCPSGVLQDTTGEAHCRSQVRGTTSPTVRGRPTGRRATAPSGRRLCPNVQIAGWRSPITDGPANPWPANPLAARRRGDLLDKLGRLDNRPAEISTRRGADSNERETLPVAAPRAGRISHPAEAHDLQYRFSTLPVRRRGHAARSSWVRARGQQRPGTRISPGRSWSSIRNAMAGWSPS